MLSKQDLVEGRVDASDDNEGVNLVIDTLHNQVVKMHMRVFDYVKEGKSEKALELRATIKELEAQVSDMMNHQMKYLKFLKATGKDAPKGQNPVPSSLKDEMSSNGTIVSMIPKN